MNKAGDSSPSEPTKVHVVKHRKRNNLLFQNKIKPVN